MILCLGGDKLEVVDEFNYLGVVIDKHLSLDTFCRKINTNGCIKLEYLKKIMKVADPALGLCVYKHMILPTFDYGDFLVEGASKDPRKYLQTVQNHCLRACFSIRDPKSITGEELHHRGGCTLLTERRRRSLLGIMYKLSRDESNTLSPVRALRANARVKLKVRRAKGALYDRSPLYRGNCEWKLLKPEVQHSGTKTIFMSKI